MFYNYSALEVREISRTSIETLEIWARRLIHDKMSEQYGPEYLNFKFDDDNYLIKREIRDRVKNFMSKEPDKFPRPVDVIFLDDICYILCNPRLYNSLFKEALDYIYPQGKEEAREFLQRLVPIRNLLSHANAISVYQAEQAVCYTNDFVEGLKLYYKDKGMEKIWNVPSIVRVQDSLGNVFDNLQDTKDPEGCVFIIEHDFRPGDKYAIDIEIDSSFSSDEYDIEWEILLGRHKQNGGTHYSVEFNDSDVDEISLINCKIISKKEWHRYGTYDFSVILQLSVFPPL